MKKVIFVFVLALTVTCWRAAFCQSQPTPVISMMGQALEVGYNKTTVVVFSANIKKVDLGSPDLEARTVKIGESERILRVKAKIQGDFSSNLHVFTDDGRIYNFQVRYSPSPADQTIDLSKVPAISAIATNASARPMLPAEVRQCAAAIAELAPVRRRPRVTSNGMQMRTCGIYIYNGVLFLQFAIRNTSGIPYGIDFSHFYIRDQKNAKRTTAMEKELRPLYVYVPEAMPIAQYREQTVVVAFDQFTIGQQKLFVSEFFEAGGDRHLQARLKGKHLLKAKPFVPTPPGELQQASSPARAAASQ